MTYHLRDLVSLVRYTMQCSKCDYDILILNLSWFIDSDRRFIDWFIDLVGLNASLIGDRRDRR